MTGRGSAPQASRAPAARTIAVVLGAALLAACTTVPTLPAAGPTETLSGRLALRVEPMGPEPAHAVSAAFDLRGNARAGTLGLSTPLGSMLAQARWSPTEVVLVTPRETRHFATLDELTREALGESVPVEAWFDWLRGRPWPGAASTAADAEPAGFRQLGWRVDLARFGEGTIVATREDPAPVVTVRIRLDPG